VLGSGFGIGFSPRTRSPSSRHPPFTHYPFPPRSLVCGVQPSPHKPRLVVSHSTCPPLSSSPHAHSFVIGPAIINTHGPAVLRSAPPPSFTQSPYPPRSLVRDGQTSPYRPRLVVSRSTCPPLSSPPHANSFVLGPAVIKHTLR